MKRKNIITTLVIVVILLLGAIGYSKYFSGNKKMIYYWRTSPVEKGTIDIIITATGTINADTSVDVGTQVSGILTKRFVDFNSVVKKNQVIALIDTTTLYANAKDAEAAVAKEQSQLDEYKREFDRTKNMFENKVAAQADYDLALTNYETAKSSLISLQAQLYKARINLGYATIRAPISGVVIARNIDAGQTVIASFNTPTLFTIVNDLSKMQVWADVAEADIGQVKVGQKVNFTVDAYPDAVFTGTVNQVRLQPISIQNVVNYVVVVDAPNPELKLIPGLTANVNILVQEHTNILKVPANALSFIPPNEYLQNSTTISDSLKQKWELKIQETGQKIIRTGVNYTIGYVWVKKGDDIFPRQIQKSITDGIYTEISGDIKERELVATGVNQSEASEQSQKQSAPQSPFMPKFPSRGKK